MHSNSHSLEEDYAVRYSAKQTAAILMLCSAFYHMLTYKHAVAPTVKALA